MHPVEIICFKRWLRYWYQPIPGHKYLVFVSKLKKKSSHTLTQHYNASLPNFQECSSSSAASTNHYLVGMGRYRYQIFDTIDTGLRCDGIDTSKQYRRVSIHARAALCMRKVQVSTHSRENQWCDLVVTVVVTGSSSQISSIEHVLRHVNMFLFLNQNLGVVYLSVCVCMCMLSTCLSCIDASLLLSIGIEKSIVSTVSKVRYSVPYQTEKNQYRPPILPSFQECSSSSAASV